MSDKLKKRIQLNAKEYKIIKQLWQTCQKADGHSARMYWNCIKARAADVNHDYLLYKRNLLTAYLGIFNFKAEEIEICALTHPLHRRQGLFRRLLKIAVADVNYKVLKRIYLSTVQDFGEGKKAVEALGAKYKHSEYTLDIENLQKLEFDTTPQAEKELTMTPISDADVQMVAQLDSICFKSPIEEGLLRFGQTIDHDDRLAYFAKLDGEIIGKMHVHFFENKAFIHDFCILPEHQGKKFGHDLLMKTLNLLKEQGRRGVELDVVATNKHAINLYLKCHFVLQHAYDYWELTPAALGKERSQNNFSI